MVLRFVLALTCLAISLLILYILFQRKQKHYLEKKNRLKNRSQEVCKQNKRKLEIK